MRSSCSSFHRLPLENQLERKSIVKQENSCFHWNPRNKKLPISDAGCSYIASHLVVVHWAGSRRARRKQIITLDLKRLNHLYQSQPEFPLIPYWNTLVSKWMRCLYTRQAIQFHCPPHHISVLKLLLLLLNIFCCNFFFQFFYFMLRQCCAHDLVTVGVGTKTTWWGEEKIMINICVSRPKYGWRCPDFLS